MKNNTLKKAFFILIPVGIILILLQSTKVKAENNIKWKAVPETAIPSRMNPNPQPAYIGTNTSIRRGENIVFDAYIDGQYILYAGNCRTQMLYRLSIGSFNKKRQPQNIRPYLNEKWFQASKFQEEVLKAACSL
ncbi:hypothetical protein NIES267_05730 [Calothrix parasitica NIES-267]|uniref:Uncharacterized protein n=1 Tax=Calothrix parasitica NIES-267 TaxID=1973488 RepID=A0A1Z4LJ48_9CYAN|nr:hypothetical protein NIES267_05730 [Calothrix parasitica NIES-267]